MTQLPKMSFFELPVAPGKVDIEIHSSFVKFVRRPKDLEDEIAKETALLESHFPNNTAIDIEGLQSISKSLATYRRYVGAQKIEPVIDLVRGEMESGAYQKIVIFAIHRDVIEQLRSAFEMSGFNPVTLYGATPAEKRQKNVDKFQKMSKCRVIIANILAGGTNVTLNAAHQVLFVEQDWVPGNNAQAAQRVHGIGQTLPVTVRFVSIADSFDEKITRALARKAKSITDLLDPVEDIFA